MGKRVVHIQCDLCGHRRRFDDVKLIEALGKGRRPTMVCTPCKAKRSGGEYLISIVWDAETNALVDRHLGDGEV